MKDKGKPDYALLVEALEKETATHSELNTLNTDLTKEWMQAFVEAYFAETNSAIQFRLTKENYCEQILRVFDDVKFAGIAVEGQDIDRAERLKDIFVMPDLSEEEARSREVLEADDLSTFYGRGKDGDPQIVKENRQQQLLLEQPQQVMRIKERSGGKMLLASDLCKQGQQRRAVLLGAPGSGKTTLMNYFAVMGASSGEEAHETEQRNEQLGPITGCLPIIVRIRDLARHPEFSVLEFVRDFATKDLSITRDLTGFFEHFLETGKVLVLLDGLDEVADVAQRYKVVEKIEAFLGQCSDCPAIITSRPAGYQRDFFRTDEYPHYELQPFDDEKITTFIEHWYNSRVELEREREQRKSSLQKALNEQPRIKQLARNPLLLTIIALIHRYQARLPKERYKLYDKAVETLLTTWDSNKALSNHEILEYLEIDDLRRLMERLAYWIHCQGGTGDKEGGTIIDRDELIRQLTQYIIEMKRVERYQAKQEARRFLEKIVRDRAGLLSLQGQDRYAFVHKTFQEYLTAMEIRDRQEDGFEVVLEHVEDYLHDSHWEEVLLLLITQQRRKNPAKILKAVLKHGSPYEEWLHRNLLFAGSILCENVHVGDDDLCEKILKDLVALELSGSSLVTSKIRRRVLSIFSNLSETDFEQASLRIIYEREEDFYRTRFLEYQGFLTRDRKILSLLALSKKYVQGRVFKGDDPIKELDARYGPISQGLLPFLKHEDSSIRYWTIEAFKKLDNRSEHVLQGLIGLLNDDDLGVRACAASTLVALGNRSELLLQEALALHKHENGLMRIHAAYILGSFGNHSSSALQSLLSLLSDDDPDVRSSAAAALGKLENYSDAVYQGLISQLKDDDWDVRRQVAVTLGRLSNCSDAVMKILFELLSDCNPEVRASTIIALSELENSSDMFLQVLISSLEDKDTELLCSAAFALKALGRSSDLVIQSLLKLLIHKDWNVRSAAREALLKLGKASDTMIIGLINLLNRNDWEVRYEAAVLLKEFGNSSPIVIRSLFDLLKDSNSRIFSIAALKLVELEESPTNILEILLPLLKNDDLSTRLNTTKTLRKLGSDSPPVLSGLFLLLQNNDDHLSFAVSSEVSTALKSIGQHSDAVLPALAQWIEKNKDQKFVGEGIDILSDLIN